MRRLVDTLEAEVAVPDDGLDALPGLASAAAATPTPAPTSAGRWSALAGDLEPCDG